MKKLPLYFGDTTDIIPTEIQAAIEDPTVIFIVAFSGGKDSVAMVLHLLDLGVPKERIHIHHHNVDGAAENLWDWACTHSYCQAFCDAFGLQLFFSEREGGIQREIHRKNEGLQAVHYQDTPGGDMKVLQSKPGNTTRGKFPARSKDMNVRWCSWNVKIGVMERVIAATPAYQNCTLVVCTGERWEESPNRAKYEELKPHKTNTKTRTVWHWHPVLTWLEGRVWAKIKEHRVQCHPAYELGWGRCSCQLCIYSSKDAWASIAQLTPWKIEKLIATEEALGFTMFSKTVKMDGKKVKVPVSVKELVEAGTSFIPADALAKWGHQIVTIFTSPIIVDMWTQPAGAMTGENSGAA